MKKIGFFTGGDSNDASTWSNVPYLFGKTLEQMGYELVRVNFEPYNIMERIFNTSMFYLYYKILRKKNCPIYRRTSLHRFFVNRRIKQATRKHGDFDLNLFLTYEYNNIYSKSKNVIWSDWSDEICIYRKGNTKPHWYEKYAVRKERESISSADLMYTMFPVCKSQMEAMYGREIRYLNRNVVNSLYNGKFDLEDIINRHVESKTLLFIGNHRYKGAAVLLIESVKKLREIYSDLDLHIIGMTNDELNISDLPQYVHPHGYLHKDNEKECDLYYSLLINSRILVNPAANWAGYSSLIEGMYFACPIITSSFDDFKEEFGRDIDFGGYCDDTNLSQKICEVMENPDYKQLCRNAHAHVKDYTWEIYVKEFIEDLRHNGVNL